MDFRTYVELPKKDLTLSHADKILMVGSCFATNMGRLLKENKFDCDINPYGVLYNPISILQALKEIREKRYYTREDLFCERDTFYSLMHHSDFNSPEADECLNKINSRIKTASDNFTINTCWIITFGSSYVYTSKKDDKVVGNCHKLPSSYFSRSMLSVETIVNEYTSFFSDIFSSNPHLKVILTVSPIRHLKDGLHGNQLSKAALLLSIQQLQECYPENVFYFPSYEIVMDELRDYRFYEEDMLHPSKTAITYIWECFTNCYFNSGTQTFLKEWKEIKNGLSHRPFRAESEQHKSFLKQLVLKIERVKEKYPNLDVDKELELCHMLLKR